MTLFIIIKKQTLTSVAIDCTTWNQCSCNTYIQMLDIHQVFNSPSKCDIVSYRKEELALILLNDSKRSIPLIALPMI